MCCLVQALCQSLVNLQQLKLAHVAGLSDAGIRGLSCLTGLTELCVLCPTNKAVSQDSLVALAPLRDIRWAPQQSVYSLQAKSMLHCGQAIHKPAAGQLACGCSCLVMVHGYDTCGYQQQGLVACCCDQGALCVSVLVQVPDLAV